MILPARGEVARSAGGVRAIRRRFTAIVIPAHAGIHHLKRSIRWVPACAGMTTAENGGHWPDRPSGASR